MSEDAYIRDRGLIGEFVATFKPDGFEPIYLNSIQSVIDGQTRSIEIDLQHLKDFSEALEERDRLLDRVIANCKRYASLFAEEIDKIIQDMLASTAPEEANVDIMFQHQYSEGRADCHLRTPDALRRRYDLFFKPFNGTVPMRMRDVRAKLIGHYVTFRGMCTRITDVKPLIEVVCYTCEGCGQEYFQEIVDTSFTPKQFCQSQSCSRNFALHIETRASKFARYQEVKVQELSEDVPVGHVPRSVSVTLMGDMTRKLCPGDITDISGIFLPRVSSGRAGNSSLVASTYVYAMSVEQHKTQHVRLEETQELFERFEKLRETSDVYTYLAKSIAPEIYGHVDVKRALLLLLCGGVTRTLPDGVKIRGDIHICLMGDPGVAKSQLLKQIVSIAPRAVYTTGRGSSGVGLTASIQRDALTADLVLEGGALVLADRGICCIDEFDKMEENDRTAIHEVMEQQTVSIAKAGITTTLNARTTVLAAANPAFGRYNTSATPQENMNLPASLLSRFDLMWLILDTPDPDSDVELARHVMSVHREGRPPTTSFDPASNSDLRAYISIARKFEPYVPEEIADNIAGAYVGIRQAEEEAGIEATGYTTARTLLSIIRLSEALARLRWSALVSEKDVEQALNLMKLSKASLEQNKTSSIQRSDPVETLFLILRNWAGEQSNDTVTFSVARELAAKNGLLDVLEACLAEYTALGVWLTDAESNVTFI